MIPCFMLALVVSWSGWSGQWAEAAPCRRQCKNDEKRNARGCCVPDPARKKSKKDRKQKPGSILINSNVDGAEIYLDGKRRRETTPATIRKLRPGTYVVEVRHGDARWKRSVEVHSGERSVNFARLESPNTSEAGEAPAASNAQGSASRQVKPRVRGDEDACYMGDGAACLRLRIKLRTSDTSLAMAYQHRACDLGGDCPRRARSEDVALARALNDEAKSRWIKDKDINAAVSRFRLAVRFDPEPIYQFNLCYALHQIGRYEWAVEACQQAEKRASGALLKKTRAVLQDLYKRVN